MDTDGKRIRDKYKTFLDGCENGITKDRIRYDSYTGFKAAVRGYNGWGKDSRFDVEYVEKVLQAMKAVSGVQIINPTTLGGITRQGEGMSDPVPRQTDESTGVSTSTAGASTSTSTPDTPLKGKGEYNYVNGITKITWDKSFSPEVTRYRVTRSTDTESGTLICDRTSDGRNQYYCDDDKTKQFGKKYTYTITTYAQYGSNEGYSEVTIDVQL